MVRYRSGEEIQHAVGALRPEPHDDTTFGHHGLAVGIPVLMLTGRGPVLQDQLVHRRVVNLGRHRRQFDGAFEYGIGEEVLPGDVQGGPGFADQVVVLGSIGRDGDADDAVVEYVMEHVRQLRSAVAPNRDQHRMAGGSGEVQCVSEFHA